MKFFWQKSVSTRIRTVLGTMVGDMLVETPPTLLLSVVQRELRT